MNKYYEEDDVNNPSHPEFDFATRVPATRKLKYKVYIALLRGDGAVLGALLDEFMADACHANVDAIDDGSIQVSFGTDGIWGNQRIRINRAEIEFHVDARIEDLDPMCEAFAQRYDSHVRVSELKTGTLAVEFNIPLQGTLATTGHTSRSG